MSVSELSIGENVFRLFLCAACAGLRRKVRQNRGCGETGKIIFPEKKLKNIPELFPVPLKWRLKFHCKILLFR